MTSSNSAFHLADRLASKGVPQLIAHDELHFAQIAANLQQSISELEEQLDIARRSPGGAGQHAMERDLDIHRLTARLRVLRRHGLDVCLGRMVIEGESGPVYVGRTGLTDEHGRRLLIDWRSPAAEPFFGATHAHPMGLVSRRRYRWMRGRVSDYWDEVFVEDGLHGHAALDDQSSFIASLGGSRSPRMRDVLSTIQSDQDAVIRAGARGTLVVDGGPGTGKTVVALHRAAYLLYSDPRIARGAGGVLFVGPHQAYLDYVEDVLPSLGEESVQICTLRDLVPDGHATSEEGDPRVAALKSSARLGEIIENAVRCFEQPPAHTMVIETPWVDIELTPGEWAEAFDAAESDAPHNEAREQVWEALLDIVIDKADDEEIPGQLLRRALLQNEELTEAFAEAWPMLNPAGLVADLWSMPAHLGRCAPWLADDDIQLLQRHDASAWTVSDLPALDAARLRVGDPESVRQERRRAAAIAAEQAEMERVVEHLIESDDSEMQVMSMLRRQDVRNTQTRASSVSAVNPDLLAGPFGHVIVDEAQELTDAEWGMLLRRCPSRSFTVVGDRAQARHGFTETWGARLARIGLDDVHVASLSINYRTPEEVMAVAEPVIREALPDANVPTSIRSSGIPVEYGAVSELDDILTTWFAEHDEGVACVIGDALFEPMPRVSSLTAEESKGLEFDLVVLVDPEAFGEGIEGTVDRYVAMTRTTRQLVVLTN